MVTRSGVAAMKFPFLCLRARYWLRLGTRPDQMYLPVTPLGAEMADEKQLTERRYYL